MAQYPTLVSGIVGGNAQQGVVFQRAGEMIQRVGRDDAALVMACLAPGIGEQDEGAPQRGLAQRGQQQAGVVAEQADIGQPLGVDLRQQAGDAVDEGFAADETDIRMRARLGGQVLARAEADFQPGRMQRIVKK